MTWTRQDLVAIDRAIATGELEVQYGDKRVRYRSMDELLRARRVILEYLQRQERGSNWRITKVRHGGKGV